VVGGGADGALGVGAVGAAMLGSLFHFITKGPNSVSKELEDEMDAEDRELARQAAAAKQQQASSGAQPGKEV